MVLLNQAPSITQCVAGVRTIKQRGKIAMTVLEQVTTDRLLIRKPVLADAEAVFSVYSNDPEVTRYLAWPRHTTVAQTRVFLEFSDVEWGRWPAGPYLIESRKGILMGSTGFAFETPQRAATGYVLARRYWGNGYATEALGAVVRIAQELNIRRLYALCNREHVASCRVLEKCAFSREGILRAYAEFPNDRPGQVQDVVCYSRTWTSASYDTNDRSRG
jgi:[ribosomal protein S5]-alanine N-acetyltransferase